MRFEKPHSLSYQLKTLAKLSPRTWVMRRVEDRRARVADEVARDELLVGVVEDALHRARLRGLLHRGVDRVLGDRLLGLEREIDERDVHRRHADRAAVELALELRDDLGERLGGAGATTGSC